MVDVLVTFPRPSTPAAMRLVRLLPSVLLVLLVLLILSLSGRPARAQPSFVTLDRMDDVSRLGLQLGLRRGGGQGRVLALRAELFGQYVLDRGGGGLYGQLPASYLILRDTSDEGALQNGELGGYLMFASGGVDWILRGGASLPLARGGPDFVANAATLYERLNDAAGLGPDSTLLRFSLSPLLHGGRVLVRADLGFDAKLGAGGAPGDVAMHASGGLAVLLGGAALTVELANFGWLDARGAFDDRWAHSLALSVRTQGRNQLHFGVVLPLDRATRDLWIFSLGVQGTER